MTEEITTEELPTPGLFEVFTIAKDGWSENPHNTVVPHYDVGKEGWYLHRNTQIGDVLTAQRNVPVQHLGRVGYKDGIFTWRAKRIPAHIFSQAHDFFRRIYEKQKTEAEVIITMHNETGEFRLFVPWQRVNGGGVKSIFDPMHVSQDHSVVGTLHSHCNFGAFHSSTDTGDASDMDGVHFTIGKVLSNPPEIVAMVMMSGDQYDYKDPNTIGDVQWGIDTAPEWWDGYVFEGQPPKEKPKGLKSLTQAHWDEFLGIPLNKPKVITPAPSYTQPYQRGQNQQAPSHWSQQPQYQRPNGPSGFNPNVPKQGTQPPAPNVTRAIIPWEERVRRDHGSGWKNEDSWSADRYASQALNESRQFNAKQEQKGRGSEDQPIWGPGGISTGDPALDRIQNAAELAAEHGLVDGEDWKYLQDGGINDTEFWQQYFIYKAQAVKSVLEALNMKVKFSASQKGPRR